MIDHSRRFIFVHIPKNAGKSVLRFFGSSWQDHRDLASYARHLDRDTFASYRKFSIVRNPFERLLSDYNFQLKKRGQDDSRLLLRKPDGRTRNFGEWVDAVLSDPFACPASQWGGRVSPHIHRWSPQVDWLRAEGLPGMDLLVRAEFLPGAFHDVCALLDLPAANLPCRNWKFHWHYSSYYRAATRRRVEEFYAADLAAFDYKFEKAPSFASRLGLHRLNLRAHSVARSLFAFSAAVPPRC